MADPQGGHTHFATRLSKAYPPGSTLTFATRLSRGDPICHTPGGFAPTCATRLSGGYPLEPFRVMFASRSCWIRPPSNIIKEEE